MINSSFSQCFEIEKILVDACGTPEGQNEMVTFIVGSQDLNVADLTVNWFSNSYGGILQNTFTAQQVANVNSTIVGCGHLLEPTGGVLPAGSEVLLITSYNFDPTAHSFVNLNDTLIVIFQNSTTTSGHFGNYDSSGGPRTLSMSFSNPSGCSDGVTYQRDQLINQNGVPGGSSALKDGGFVSFTPNGTASYDNLGCQVPGGILAIDITSNITSVCGGENIDLTAVVNGAYQNIVWSSTEGTFSSQGNLTTTMTVNNTVSNSFYIYGGVVSNCSVTVLDSVLITISGAPNTSITASSNTLCTGQNVVLTASGASSYVWNQGSSTNSAYTITSGGTYTVIGTSSCGATAASIIIDEMAPPANATLDIFTCDSMNTSIAPACDNCSYLWGNGSTGTSLTTNGMNPILTMTNVCGSATVNFDYSFPEGVITTSNFDLVNDTNCIGVSPAFQNLSTGANQYEWSFGNGTFGTSPNVVYGEPGNYEIELIAIAGACKDTSYHPIVIVNCDIPTEAIIPNVFTPNGDSYNDEFFIQTINGSDLTGTIFNRWGRKVHELKGLDATWNGRNSNGGTYYYIIEVKFIDDSTKEYEGHIQLIK